MKKILLLLPVMLFALTLGVAYADGSMGATYDMGKAVFNNGITKFD